MCHDFANINIESFIRIIRGQKVMLDSDLAMLYGVTTSRLNEQVKRNINRFPDDFMFQLTKEYSNEKGHEVFVVLGVGGDPSMPEELYLIPLDSILQVQSKPTLIKQYRRDIVDKLFSINEFETS